MGEQSCIQFQNGNQVFIIPINNKEYKKTFDSNIFNGGKQNNLNCCEQLFNNSSLKRYDDRNVDNDEDYIANLAAKNNTKPSDNNNFLEARLNALEKLIKDLINNLNNKSTQSDKAKTEASIVDPIEARVKELENVVKIRKEQQEKEIGKGEIKLLDKTLHNNKTIEQPATKPAKVKQKKKKAPVKNAAKKKPEQKNSTDGWWNASEREMKKLGYTHQQYIDYRIATGGSRSEYLRKHPEEVFNDQDPFHYDRFALAEFEGLNDDDIDKIVNDPDYISYHARSIQAQNPDAIDWEKVHAKKRRFKASMEKKFGIKLDAPHLN